MTDKQLLELKEYLEWITNEIYRLKVNDAPMYILAEKLEKFERLQKLSYIFKKL